MDGFDRGHAERCACRHIRRAAIVDDDPRVQASIAIFLDEMGIATEAAASGISASWLRSFDPDLILLDVCLGVSDAFTILRSHIPPDYRGVVSIVSGTSVDVIMDAMLLGERLGLRMGMPILKPFGLDDIRHVVAAADELLERRSIAVMARSEQGIVHTSHGMRLRDALDGGLLEVWYQPKFAAATGCIVGAEALIRARVLTGEIISPFVLLRDVAKQDMLDLTDYLLMTVVQHSEELLAMGFNKSLSVNVPVSYLLQPDPSRWLRAPSRNPQWPGLIFEVTEDEALSDVVDAQMVATQLRLYSVIMSIDDFGAAYSSLSRLRDLPFRELKLDRSFVHGCAIDSTKRSICASVLTLGAELGVTTVAEGVENDADLQVLIQLGCDQVQGFLLAKPMPFGELQKFIQARRPGPVSLSRPDRLLLEAYPL